MNWTVLLVFVFVSNVWVFSVHTFRPLSMVGDMVLLSTYIIATCLFFYFKGLSTR